VLQASEDQLNKLFKSTNEAPLAQKVAEVGTAAGGSASIGVVTQTSNILRRLGPTRPQSVVRMLIADPEKMKSFVERVKKRGEPVNTVLMDILQTANIVTEGDTPDADLYKMNAPLEGGFVGEQGKPLKIDIPYNKEYNDSDENFDYRMEVEPMASVFDAVDHPEMLGKVEADSAEELLQEPQKSLNTEVGSAIQKSVSAAADEASRRAGVPQNFLKVMLSIESGMGKFDPSNPGQIQGPAWSDMVKKYGSKYGITASMKNDTRANVLMSAHYLADQATSVSRKLGRKARPWEVYMSYNMGPENYNRFVKLMKEKKSTPVASALVSRSHAEGNAPFFFDNKKPNGKALNYKQVAQRYKEYFDKKTKEFSQFLS